MRFNPGCCCDTYDPPPPVPCCMSVSFTQGAGCDGGTYNLAGVSDTSWSCSAYNPCFDPNPKVITVDADLTAETVTVTGPDGTFVKQYDATGGDPMPDLCDIAETIPSTTGGCPDVSIAANEGGCPRCGEGGVNSCDQYCVGAEETETLYLGWYPGWTNAACDACDVDGEIELIRAPWGCIWQTPQSRYLGCSYVRGPLGYPLPPGVGNCSDMRAHDGAALHLQGLDATTSILWLRYNLVGSCFAADVEYPQFLGERYKDGTYYAEIPRCDDCFPVGGVTLNKIPSVWDIDNDIACAGPLPASVTITP